MVIDGQKIASEILGRLAAEPKPEKFLAAILVGEDKSSVSFLAQKEKVAKTLGVDFRLYKFPATSTNDELREEVGKIAAHKTCGGVIVQLPLPEGVNRHYVLNAIPPEKDVDVLGERAIGSFYVERAKVLPPAVGAVEEILRASGDGANASTNDVATILKSHSVALVGLGLLVGRPIATWIMWRAKETFLLRSTSDLNIIKNADIVITGAGKAGLVKLEMLKDGTLVIDFGYENNKGDFEASGGRGASIELDNIRYTPTPGGTGPILVAKLFENFYKLNAPEK